MANLILTKPITADDVEAREAQEGVGREIINGAWAEDNEMAGEIHNIVALNIAVLLRQHVKAHQLGRVYTDNLNYVLKGTPQKIEIMRIPDASFVSQARLAEPQQGYLYFAPDLAVEVVSPSEKQPKTIGKLHDYLTYGAQQVWVVYPETRQVIVHTPDGNAVTYNADDTLTGGTLLPNFAVKVSEIFEA